MIKIITHIVVFVVGLYLGTELQAWWSRTGCKKFIERQMTKMEGMRMKSIDPVMIKQAVKEGQLVFYVNKQYNGTFIYVKDTTTEECVCVGTYKIEGEENE